jgi:hypothetical protein
MTTANSSHTAHHSIVLWLLAAVDRLLIEWRYMGVWRVVVNDWCWQMVIAEDEIKVMEEALKALNIKIERGVRAPIMESKGTPFTEEQEADRVYIYKSGIPNTGKHLTHPPPIVSYRMVCVMI